MATPAKSVVLNEQEVKLVKRALNKLDASTSRFLTVSQKEENEKAIASTKEELAQIATLKARLI